MVKKLSNVETEKLLVSTRNISAYTMKWSEMENNMFRFK